MVDIIKKYMARVCKKAPVVHNIANGVSIHQCAGITLAAGARPVMADYYRDVVYITAGADALALNMGMMSDERLRAMKAAAKTASDKGIPIVIDPVGLGSSEYRRECFGELLKTAAPAVIRGNENEIRAAISGESVGRGIDFDGCTDIDGLKRLASEAAQALGATVFISGEYDAVSDGRRTAVFKTGDPMLKRVTGAGCMLTSLIGAYAAANSDSLMASVVAGMLFGEGARLAVQKGCASGTAAAAITDEIYTTTEYYRHSEE